MILTILKNPLYIDFPIQWMTWMGWAILLGLITAGNHSCRDWRWFNQPRLRLIFAGLAALVPLTALFGGLRFTSVELPPIPGLPIEPVPPLLMLFSALPWVLAAGMLGPGAASLLAALSGIFLALFETHNIFTPLEYAGLATIFAAAVRQNYRTLFFRFLRHPLGAAFFAGVCFVPFYLLIAFLVSQGSLASRIDYALTQSWRQILPHLAATVISAGIAEVFFISHHPSWWQSSVLIPSPAEKSIQLRFFFITAPFVLLIFITLMASDWVISGKAAERLIQERLASTTNVAAESLPYFLEAGQNLTESLATSDLLNKPAAEAKITLEKHLRDLPYFRQIFLLDANGNPVTGYPLDKFEKIQPSAEERAGIQIALRGVPLQLYSVPPWPGENSAQISFIAAIYNPSGDVGGAVISRTDLLSNPFTQPAIEALVSLKDIDGAGYILNEDKTILYHTLNSELMDKYSGAVPSQTSFFKEISLQGSQRMVYSQPVVGSPWSVIVEVPADRALQLALDTASPLLLLLLVLSAIVMLLLRVGLKSITTLMGNLATEANLIAHGNLDRPLSVHGEDEIGQFGKAFEKMRLSLKARMEEQQSLLNISQGVASNLDVQQSVIPILQAAAGDGACLARIVLVREAAMEPSSPGPFVGFGYGSAASQFSFLDAQVFSTMQRQNLLTITDASRTRHLVIPAGKQAPGSMICVAIRHETSYLGALWVAYPDQRKISEETTRFLSTLAGQASLAAENSRLYASAEVGRQRLEAILASTPEPVLVFDSQMNLYLLNPAALQVPALVNIPSPGQPVRDVIIPSELVDLVLKPSNQGILSREISLANGRHYYVSVSPVTSDGMMVGKVCLLRDVSYYKEIDTLKSDFVSTVSHDLRSPLTLVRGYATMLEMVGDLNEQQKSFVTKILTGVENMSRLVNNLLDLGRIEAGISLNIDNFNSLEILEAVTNSLAPQAAQKKIQINVEPQEAPQPVSDFFIQADRALLQQAVYNLVENAIRFTPVSGQVTLRLQKQDKSFVFGITDTGIGIAPLDLPHMFEKFYRSGRRDPNRQRGTGLGLAIVKSIVERHNGRVWVESQLGKGSTFNLSIPVKYIPVQVDDITN